MNGCVYRTADNQCEKFSDRVRNTLSWCVGDDPCEARTPSNADKIRAMSDEELAEFFGTLPCCPPGSAEELCYPENTCGADTKMMAKCWGTWLKRPVDVDG